MPTRTMRYTAKAADNATMNEPANALIAPKSPKVSLAPAPPYTAPIITKTEATRAIGRKRAIFEPTAVPKILAASFAPKDHPRKRPLLKKKR